MNYNVPVFYQVFKPNCIVFKITAKTEHITQLMSLNFKKIQN